MLKRLRKSLVFLVIFLIHSTLFAQVAVAKTYPNLNDLGLTAKSALVMDLGTGAVVYEKNADEALPPASVTKVMTLLLIYEAQAEGRFQWTDMVTVSDHAATMGGSQAYLEPHEQQTAEDMVKCIVIASANDAAVAMAEFVAGSEEGFVQKMNEKAKALGMEHTNFANACGLPAAGHVTSARDIAIMSRELMGKFPEIQKYTTIWMDSIIHKTKRGESEFGLSNTNKLLKWYTGTTGLKTGSTDEAGFCMSATAEKNGLHLIGVVMGVDSGTVRFQEAMKLLDYGFANYAAKEGAKAGESVGQLPVDKGMTEMVDVIIGNSVNLFAPKEKIGNIQEETVMLPGIAAPFPAGAKVGDIVYTLDGEELGRAEIVTANAVEKINLLEMIGRLLWQW